LEMLSNGRGNGHGNGKANSVPAHDVYAVA
jgi:hypothetical protein